MTVLSQTILLDGQALFDQIVDSMKEYPVLGGDCTEPVYLLRYTDGYGVKQYQQNRNTFWTSAFTTSCERIGRLIGFELLAERHTQLWALKVNANFFFEDKFEFTDPNHIPYKAECEWAHPGCEVTFYGEIPERFLYVQDFALGKDCL